MFCNAVERSLFYFIFIRLILQHNNVGKSIPFSQLIVENIEIRMTINKTKSLKSHDKLSQRQIKLIRHVSVTLFNYLFLYLSLCLSISIYTSLSLSIILYLTWWLLTRLNLLLMKISDYGNEWMKSMQSF